MIAGFLPVVNNEFSVLEIYINKGDTMKFDATWVGESLRGGKSAPGFIYGGEFPPLICGAIISRTLV